MSPLDDKITLSLPTYACLVALHKKSKIVLAQYEYRVHPQSVFHWNTSVYLTSEFLKQLTKIRPVNMFPGVKPKYNSARNH